jgi:hypothetical protein
VNLEELPRNPEQTGRESNEQRNTKRDEEQARKARRGEVFIEARITAESARH